MADLTITAANVAAAASATIVNGSAGATVTAGQAVYLDTNTNTYKLSDADASSTTGRVDGVALNGAASGQPLRVITRGDLTAGATLAVGEIYVISGTAGAICPVGDYATGDYLGLIGIARTTAILDVLIHNVGVARA